MILLNNSFKNALFILFILSPLLLSKTYAQTSDNYSVEANIIYRFTKYVDWPQIKKNGQGQTDPLKDRSLHNSMALKGVDSSTTQQKLPANDATKAIIDSFKSPIVMYECKFPYPVHLTRSIDIVQISGLVLIKYNISKQPKEIRAQMEMIEIDKNSNNKIKYNQPVLNIMDFNSSLDQWISGSS